MKIEVLETQKSMLLLKEVPSEKELASHLQLESEVENDGKHNNLVLIRP